MPAVTVPENIMTLVDVATRSSPAARSIVEIMSLTNDIITDAPAIMCNNGTVHDTMLRDNIPLPQFRMVNQGSPIVKSATRNVRENTGELSNWIEVDRTALLQAEDQRLFLLNESRAILEGLSQAGAHALWYGDYDLDPAAFMGFTPRYDILGPVDDYPQSRNVIDAGGVGIPDPDRPGYTTNLTSIWLIQWDPAGCHLLFPRGTTAGVKNETFRDQIIRDTEHNPFVGLMVHYWWTLGLSVRDWRRVVRICNIDTNELGTLVEDGAATTAEQRLMRQLMYAISLLPPGPRMRTMFYMNRIPSTMMDILAAEKGNVQLQYTNSQGTGPLTTFLGVPIRRSDGLIVGEKQVVAAPPGP